MIALLRGVNVNGIKIKSADLKTCFEKMGYTNVKTILQTGNVIFDGHYVDGMKEKIEAGLNQTFGYDARIILVDDKEMRDILKAYPFEIIDSMQPYIIFTSNMEIKNELLSTGAQVSDDVKIGPSEVIYWTVEKGQTLDSPFGKILGKSQYKPYVTTRNLRTVEKIVAATEC